LYWILLVSGLMVLALEIFASRRNRTTAQAPNVVVAWRFVHKWRLLFGIPLAVASFFMGYPTSGGGEEYKVIGVPFLVAAFDSAGRDYIGLLSVPSLVANALLWLFLPAVALWVWSRFFKWGSQHA
jgi:hypothetical protein